MANLISRTTIYLNRPKNTNTQVKNRDKKVINANTTDDKKGISRTSIYLHQSNNGTKNLNT